MIALYNPSISVQKKSYKCVPQVAKLTFLLIWGMFMLASVVIVPCVFQDEADGQSKGSLESIQEHSITGSTEHRIASGNGDVFPPANGNGSSSKVTQVFLLCCLGYIRSTQVCLIVLLQCYVDYVLFVLDGKNPLKVVVWISIISLFVSFRLS